MCYKYWHRFENTRVLYMYMCSCLTMLAITFLRNQLQYNQDPQNEVDINVLTCTCIINYTVVKDCELC